MTETSDTGGMVSDEMSEQASLLSPVETPPVSEPPPLTTDELVKAADAYVASLKWTLDDLSRACNELCDPLLLAGYLADLRDHIQDARRAYDEIERSFLTNAGEKSYDVPNLGRVEVKGKTKRTKWQHDELFRHVLARIADDRTVFWNPEDGTFLPPAEIARLIVERLRDTMSPSWKVTGIRSMGLQVDEFCDEQPDGFSVVLPSRKAA